MLHKLAPEHFLCLRPAMVCLSSKSKKSKPPHPQNANGTGGATVIVETSPKTSPRIPASVTDNSSNNRTALNVFKFTLGALSTASEGVPIPGVKLAIESLLTITNHIQVRYRQSTARSLQTSLRCIH